MESRSLGSLAFVDFSLNLELRDCLVADLVSIHRLCVYGDFDSSRGVYHSPTGGALQSGVRPFRNRSGMHACKYGSRS